jgi:hypothetical protein
VPCRERHLGCLSLVVVAGVRRSYLCGRTRTGELICGWLAC